ncbi:amidohydrolase [Acuticoccus sediminis]|uniref:Amidohydrolase n=1 Tax=Acuticoccus sediminis TaxID=2184697 RepID=A0A8B2NY07_9HYPH|nr:amidohydrolase family protein [Acuticoccus sediminis]RAI02434.1 amidohydrolase [Acuticoccus sediminis]
MAAPDTTDALSRPRIAVPAGACDTHMHIYDNRYPTSEKAYLFPPDRTVADYRKVQARLGLERTVIVQPVTYGFDNSCTMDAVADLGDTARAVVTVPVDIPEAELDALWRKGARGFRFHQMRGGMLSWDELKTMAGRIAGSPWHVQVQLDGLELPQYEALLADLPTTVVLDHMGRFSEPVGLDHEAVQALLRLVRRPNVYVKMSGVYYISATGEPDYADMRPLAAALAGAAEGRVLWGSDWPHPTKSDDEMPDDAALLDFLAAAAPDEAARKTILVDTPAKLYGF